MGNLCSHHDSEKFEYLQNRLEDQSTHLEELHRELTILRRENKYFKNRLEKNITYNANIL
jgi:hypothetical protein